MKMQTIHRTNRRGAAGWRAGSLLVLAAFIVTVAAFLQGCSTTAFLPEGEVLYTGISDISFGQKSKKVPQKATEEEGVITAIDEAVTNVGRILSGLDPLVKDDTPDLSELTDFERDSIESEQEKLQETEGVMHEEVEAVLSIPPNNSLMGSARYRFPLPFGLWFYNAFVGSRTAFGKWMFNVFAANPKFISTINPSLRTKIAKNVLRNYGYFRGSVEYDLIPQKDPRKAKVAYSVFPGPLSRFDNIEYQQFTPMADSLIRAHASESLLSKGAPFTAATLDAERNRLNTLFRNNGFYYCQPTFFTYRADTLQRPGWVQLQVRPSRDMALNTGKSYHLRNTVLHLIDPQRGYEETDSLGRHGAIKMLFAGKGDKRKPPVKFGVMRRYVFYKKGDLYRQRMADLVQEKISGMGIFSQVSLNYTPSDTLPTCDSLDVDIYAVLDKPYDAEFKASATTKSNGLVGPGLEFGMTKRNAFHGAEDLRFQIYGSYEWQTGAGQQGRNSLMNSFEYGTSLSLDYPYIKLGRLARRYTRNAISSTSFKIEANWLNRAGYFGRVSLGTRVVLNYQKMRNVKHELTPFRLDYELKLHSTHAFDSIMSVNNALAVSMRDQFVPSMQYVLNMNTGRNARNPRTFALTIKEAGNVLSGIYSCFGQSFNQKNKNLFGVPFAQFVKATATLTQHYNFRQSKVSLAGRLFMGAVYSYGNATVAPYSDLFTIGGANSLRAFAIRSIGPGSYHPEKSQYSYVNQLGDFKFEANLECRFPLIGNLNGAVFLDCGNVWMLNNNEDHPGGALKLKNLGDELALGTGVGLRYDLDFLVIRFDLGIGIHSPYDTGKRGYYNMTSFGNSLGYHLAIGYPF